MTGSEAIARGPNVVAIGGGHGLAATLRAARTYAGSLTAVVSVADDGGSTGRLRSVTDRPAPGDLRKCLAALAAEDSALARALDHRFVGGELDGHAFGNLLIVAMSDSGGGLVDALDEIGRLVGATGRVLPASSAPAHLVARCGGQQVSGQVAIMECNDIETVAVQGPIEASPEALEAISGADQILLGPGSLFTSVLAAAVVPGITEAIRSADAPLVYVCNLHPQRGETEGYDLADHLSALQRHGIVPDVVVYDPSTLSAPDPDRSHGAPALVAAPMANRSGLAHDPERLGQVLAESGMAALRR